MQKHKKEHAWLWMSGLLNRYVYLLQGRDQSSVYRYLRMDEHLKITTSCKAKCAIRNLILDDV